MSARRDEYIRTIWVNKVTPLSANNFNHIEEGIEIANELAIECANFIDEIKTAIVDQLFFSIDPSTKTITLKFGTQVPEDPEEEDEETYYTPNFFAQKVISLSGFYRADEVDAIASRKLELVEFDGFAGGENLNNQLTEGQLKYCRSGYYEEIGGDGNPEVAIEINQTTSKAIYISQIKIRYYDENEGDHELIFPIGDKGTDAVNPVANLWSESGMEVNLTDTGEGIAVPFRLTFIQTDNKGFYIGGSSGKGLQIGSSSKPAAKIIISTTYFAGLRIDSVTVTANVASGANASMSVHIGDIDANYEDDAEPSPIALTYDASSNVEYSFWSSDTSEWIPSTGEIYRYDFSETFITKQDGIIEEADAEENILYLDVTDKKVYKYKESATPSKLFEISKTLFGYTEDVAYRGDKGSELYGYVNDLRYHDMNLRGVKNFEDGATTSAVNFQSSSNWNKLVPFTQVKDKTEILIVDPQDTFSSLVQPESGKVYDVYGTEIDSETLQMLAENEAQESFDSYPLNNSLFDSDEDVITLDKCAEVHSYLIARRYTSPTEDAFEYVLLHWEYGDWSDNICRFILIAPGHPARIITVNPGDLAIAPALCPKGIEPSYIVKNQATTTIIRDPLTNINGRTLSSYEATFEGYGYGYDRYHITYGGQDLTEEQAKNYMEYMTGSRLLPVYNYEKPQNSLFIMADGSFWKPQWSTSGDYAGFYLFKIHTPIEAYLNPTDYSSSEIKWSKMLVKTISADTTFTFEEQMAGCKNEYKAIITNGGSSAITVTLPSGVSIETNDDSIVISNNTFTLPNGVTVELNCVNNWCIIYNHDAQ